MDFEEQKQTQQDGITTDVEATRIQHHRVVPDFIPIELEEPYRPRANIAVSTEAPIGTTKGDWNIKHKNKSVLEQHCEFWDRDGDGIIWPLDTFRGFHQLGYNLFLSVMAIFIIHLGFSYWTIEGWLPDPFFRVYLKNMHRAKHGSDSGTYDREGRFIPYHFEEMFSKYDVGQKGGLTYLEGMRMIRGNRLINDPTGWGAAFFEFTATYLLAWPKDGVVPKEFIRRVYDGSIFFEIASERQGKPLYKVD